MDGINIVSTCFIASKNLSLICSGHMTLNQRSINVIQTQDHKRRYFHIAILLGIFTYLHINFGPL